MTRRWPWLRAQIAGALFDVPPFALASRAPRLARRLGMSWETLHNRGERISRHPRQRGVRCDWRWTSSLRYCERRPKAGLQLMGAALADWPIEFAGGINPTAGAPRVSFVVGHRGAERIPLLLATLRSIGAQEGVAIECIVVEQAEESILGELLPGWVRHIHSPPPESAMPYSRSWAFNVGAREARGECLILHDNDILVPRRYAAEASRVLEDGFDAARVQRLLFYLDPEDTEALTSTRAAPTRPPLQVVQNCEGGTLVVKRDVYWSVGGHDESFVGWGGEDNEFLDRLRTRILHDHAYLPFLHLHHAPQPGQGVGPADRSYFERRMLMPAAARIAELTARNFGSPLGPGGGDRQQAACARPS